MTIPIRPVETALPRALGELKRDAYSATRATGSGRPRPIPIKLGATPPSDADYTAATVPPIGTLVYFPSSHKLYVRDAGAWPAATWLASTAFS